MELQGFQVDVAQLQGAYFAEGLVETPQRDSVAPVGTAGQSAAVVFAVVVEVVPGILRECGHVLHASLRWVDPLADALVVERDGVVLLVEPSECLRLVFQAEVPADLLPQVERVDVSRLEGGGVAVRVPADDHRPPFPAFSRLWLVFRVLHWHSPSEVVRSGMRAPASVARTAGRGESVDVFLGACRCLVENERNRQVSQGQTTLE